MYSARVKLLWTETTVYILIDKIIYLKLTCILCVSTINLTNINIKQENIQYSYTLII